MVYVTSDFREGAAADKPSATTGKAFYRPDRDRPSHLRSKKELQTPAKQSTERRMDVRWVGGTSSKPEENFTERAHIHPPLAKVRCAPRHWVVVVMAKFSGTETLILRLCSDDDDR